MGFHYGPSVLVFAIFGWFVGLIFGGADAHRCLGILSKNGEYRLNRKTLAGGLIIIIIIVIIYTITAYPIITSMTVDAQILLNNETWDFTSSFIAAIYAAQTILFGRWEGKHGRMIVSDRLWFSRMYVFPEARSALD